MIIYRPTYLKLCISRILQGGDLFSLDIEIYLYQNSCTHSVTRSKTRDLVIVFIARSFWYMTFARVDTTPCKKPGEFSLLIYPKCVLSMS